MLSAVIGFFSGIISGMGIGGGVVLIPSLIFIYSINQKLAQGINLTYFIPTAIISLAVHIKRKNVDIKTAAVIGAFGCIGAIGGSLLALKINGDILSKIFGGFLAIIGIREIYKGIRS